MYDGQKKEEIQKYYKLCSIYGAVSCFVCGNRPDSFLL